MEDPDELRLRSVDLAGGAEAARQVEPVVTRALADPDVLVSALLSPGTALRLERALLHAVTNPVGLGLALAGDTVADILDGIGTALGGMPRAALHSQLAAAVQVVLHVVRVGGARRLAGIGVLVRDGDLVRVVAAWEDGRRAAGWAQLRTLLEARGRDVPC
jgi:pilus assembly protein CpaF